MKNVLTGKAIMLSQQITERYWKGDIDFAEPYFAPDIEWVGSSQHSHMSGRERLMTWLRESQRENPNVNLSELTFYPVESFSNGCVVFGTYLRTVEPQEGYLMQDRQRITLVWKLPREGEMICSHIHVSNPIDLVEPGGTFPFRISRQSWEFVQRQLERGGQRLSVKTTDGKIRVTSLDTVAFLEAKDRYTIVHALEGALLICRSLSEMEARLDARFLRIGRSYIVNLDFVQTLDGNRLLLNGGDSVLVPARLLPEVRRVLLDEK